MTSSKIASEGPVLSKRLVTVDGVVVSVTKLPDDPIALRASLGGDPAIGYYIAYRGDEMAVAHLIDHCLRAFSHIQKP